MDCYLPEASSFSILYFSEIIYVYILMSTENFKVIWTWHDTKKADLTEFPILTQGFWICTLRFSLNINYQTFFFFLFFCTNKNIYASSVWRNYTPIIGAMYSVIETKDVCKRKFCSTFRKEEYSILQPMSVNFPHASVFIVRRAALKTHTEEKHGKNLLYRFTSVLLLRQFFNYRWTTEHYS